MKRISLGGALLLAAIFAVPAFASADTISSETLTFIPAQGASCVALQATNFNAFVYDGAMHSFEFTVPDASYVAVGGTVGEGVVPFWLTSRRVDQTGALRIHVDLPTTPIVSTLPATITLLSSKQGQPTCMSTISMTITPRTGVEGGTTSSPINTPSPIATPGTTPGTTPTPAKETPVVETPEKEGEGVVSAPIPAAISSTQAFIAKMCTYNNGSQVWALLLALYALIVAAALLTPIRSLWGIEEWVLRLALVAIPLGFLIAFWFVAESCRAGYMPLITSLIVGGAGAYGVYRTQPGIISAQKSLITLQ